MDKKVKALGLVSLGLIIWSALAYIAIAFLKVETNPSIWSEGERFWMLVVIFFYIAFIPLMVISVKDEL
jgi:hypothetical protein